MSLATLADSTATALTIHWPAWGLWWAEVAISDPAELSGVQTLTVAGEAFSGAVVSGGAFNGRAAYRLGASYLGVPACT